MSRSVLWHEVAENNTKTASKAVTIINERRIGSPPLVGHDEVYDAPAGGVNMSPDT